MKKRLCFLFSAAFFGLLISGCGGGAKASQQTPSSEEKVTTTSSSTRSSLPTSSSSSSAFSSSSQHVHTFSEEWTYDDSYHWHVATCEHTELKNGIESHQMTEWASDDNGNEERHCRVCPYAETRTIADKFIDILVFELNPDGNTYQIKQNQRYYAYDEIYIPNKYQGKDVTVIGEQAFYGCSKLKTIHLPNTLTTIGNKAFYNCESLMNIELPESVKTIGEQAFYFCTSLSKIDLSHVDKLDNGAFQATYALKYIDISGVKEVGSYAFIYSSICHIKFSVDTKFGDSPFKYNYYLSKIECIGQLAEGEDMDEYIDNLFPDKSSYYDAFRILYDETGKYLIAQYRETGATGPYISRTVLVGYIGEEEEIIIPHGFAVNQASYTLDEIGKGCFSYNNYLKKVRIGNGVDLIADNAFNHATNLKEVQFASPQSTNVKVTIGEYAFAYTGLEKVELNENIISVGACAFNTNTIQEVKLSNSLEYIGRQAFQYINLGAVEDESGVYYFGSETNPYLIAAEKYNYTGAANYSFKEGCKFIEEGLFRGMQNSLTAITLPDGLIQISDYAFLDTFVSEVTIPASIKYIGENSFPTSSKAQIKTGGDITNWLNCHYPENGLFSGLTFLDATGSAITNLVIPHDYKGFIPSYRFAQAKDLQYITISDGVTAINSFAFYMCQNVVKLTVGDGVKTINYCAFAGCDNLSQVILGRNVETIGESAFYCSNLREIINHSSLSLDRSFSENGSIGYFAWSFQTSEENARVSFNKEAGFANYKYHYERYNYDTETATLVEESDEVRAFNYFGNQAIVTIPQNVTQLYETFKQNDLVTNVTIGSNVKRIYSYTFSTCLNLETITIDNGVQYLASHAFHNLKKITTITLPKSIKYCNTNVFSDCDNLTDIYYQGTIAEFGAIILADEYAGYEWGTITRSRLLGSNSNAVIHCTDGNITSD